MARKKKINPIDKVIGLTRIALGSIFLWAFVDKLWGLGFATCRDAETEAVNVLCEKAWLEGGSPTTGFLKFGTDGPLADFYQGLAGNTFIDWLFMIGLLGIGLALILGIGIKIAAVSGTIMMLMMWSAALPPANNPIMDDHIIYALVLWVIYFGNANQQYGLRDWWKKQDVVKQFPVLE